MKGLFALALASAACFGYSEIRYRVDALPFSESLQVTMTLPNTQKGSLLQIPNWAPGAYVLRDNFKNVSNLIATNEQGETLKIDVFMTETTVPFQVGEEKRAATNQICTWKVAPAKTTTIRYSVPLRVVDGAMHWSGPSTYLYEVNRLRENIHLKVSPPPGWPVYVGLDEIPGEKYAFSAPNYDVLADNPVSTGNLQVDTYSARGKNHYIVSRGVAKSKLDRQKLVDTCKFISNFQTDFFGGDAPYSKYVWHFDVNDAPDGAGGLEHLSSTQISLASGLGPGAIGVLSHEFFHLWNVKRVRSKVLGPFDYTQLPETGALWWLEGVTDYYAHTLLYRYGMNDERMYFNTALRNINSIRQNPAQKVVGPFESSLRVREASNGRGNSNGYRISYYNQGWVAGLVLDLWIRSESKGKRSLDDVQLALWKMCAEDKPGFEEDAIRKLVVRFGGANLGPVFDDVVMKGGDMRLDETLAKAGLRISDVEESFVDLGFSLGPNPNGPGAIVQTVSANQPGLKVGDIVLKIGEREVQGGGMRAIGRMVAEVSSNANVGISIPLQISRNGQAMTAQVTPTEGKRKSFRLNRMPEASEAARALAANWLKQKALKL